MYIRKLSINGIKGINKRIDLDFTPSSSEKLSDNIVSFGLERNIKEFAALKQIGFIGLNSSGKTSLLFAIAFAIGLIESPDRFLRDLSRIRNIFSNEPISVSLEIVGPPIDKTNNSQIKAQKYLIEYEYNKGEFTKESVRYSQATKTTFKDYEYVYQVKDKKVYIEGKDINASHNLPNYTLFALLRAGQFNQNLLGNTYKKHANLFGGLNIILDSLWPREIPIGFGVNQMQIQIPKLDSHRKLMLNLARIFDNKLQAIDIDQTGKVIFKIKNNQLIEKFELNQMENYLSSGTKMLLQNFGLILNSILSRNIILFDEMGSTIHFGLFKTYFEIFRKSKSQLFFTTHNEKIFSQNLRLDQIFSVDNKNGNVSITRLSDIEDLDPRYVSTKKITQALDANPDFDAIVDLLDKIDDMSTDE